MNRARSDRSLGSMEERTHKRLRTVDETGATSDAGVGTVLCCYWSTVSGSPRPCQRLFHEMANSRQFL